MHSLCTSVLALSQLSSYLAIKHGSKHQALDAFARGQMLALQFGGGYRAIKGEGIIQDYT